MKEGIPSLATIQTTRNLACEVAEQEVCRVREKLSSKQKPWNREYRNTDAYSETFRPVLGKEDICDMLRRMKAAKLPSEPFVAMDIMGTGSVFTNLPEGARPDIVIAITLVDYRSDEERSKEEQQGIYVIGTHKDDLSQHPTSVALPHTWVQFEKLRKRLGIQAIDFAVARPLGGMHTIPSEHPWFLAWMVQKVYKHLNPNNGVLLTEAPQHTYDLLKHWAQQANQNGFDITLGLIHEDPDFLAIRPAVKIVRHVHSPENIAQSY